MPDTGDPTLSEQDRKKLDTIVEQMHGNRESDENIQFVVNDFKKKYGNAGGNKPYVSTAKTTPEAPIMATDHPVTIKGPTQELSQEQIQKLPTVQQKHDEEVGKSANKVNETLANIHPTAANVLRHQQTAEKIKTDQQAERNAQEMGKPYTPELSYHVATDDEVKKLAEDPNEHPKLLAAKVEELNAEGKKKDANALKADTYTLISSKNTGNREKQLHNKELIAQGKLDYDINTHQLIKHVDGIEGAIEAGNQSVRNTVGAVELFKADDEKKAEILNKAFAEHDPDKPVVKIGGVSNFVGGQLPMLATGAIPGIGSGLMTGQMAAQGYYGGMMETYPRVKAQLLKEKYPDKSEAEINELISKPDAEIDPAAVKKATTVANEHGIVDAVTAHFMGKVAGPEVKTKPFSIGTQEAIKLTADAAKVSALFGAGQAIKNNSSEAQGVKPEESSVLNATLQGAMMHAGFFVIAKGSAALKAAGRDLIKHNLSEQPAEEIQKTADNLVEKGLIPKEKADEVVADVLEHKELNAQIPDKVKNEEVRVDITKKIKRKQELEEELKKVNSAFKPEYKEKIAAIDEKITEQANSPEAKKPAEKAVEKEPEPIKEDVEKPVVEPIAEKKEKTVETGKTDKEPVKQLETPVSTEKPVVKETLTPEKPVHEEAIAAAKEHMKPEMAAAFAEDPESGLKEAAQQLNASPSEAKTARAFYGDKLSDLALKAFPDEKAPELGSKTELIKDDKGESATFYHGTKRKGLTELQASTGEQFGKGVYFGSGKSDEIMDRGDGGEVIEAHLPDRLIEAGSREYSEIENKIEEETGYAPDNHKFPREKVNDELKKRGYKGVIMDNDLYGGKEAMVFDGKDVVFKNKPAREKPKATKLDQPGEKITTKEDLQKAISLSQQENDVLKNSYPQYAKKYPGITQDEYNVQRMVAYKKQVAARTPLPKFGEKTEGGAEQEGDVHKILKTVAEDTDASPVQKKAVELIQKAAEKIPGLKIDTEADFSKGEYKGHKIDKDALGYSFPDGTIIINTDAHASQKQLQSTVVHEVMHAITRHGIDTNEALKTELRDVLTDVRKALKVPDLDALVPELVKRGIIDENKYGASNEHEMIAEVFSNQKFYDMLKGMEYKGDNLLKRAYIAIAKYFSSAYKGLSEAKASIKADNIADYLMELTEKTLKPGTGEGEALGLDKGSEEEKFIKSMIQKYSDVDKQDLHDVLVANGHDAADVDRLIKQNEEEQQLGAEGLVKRAKAVADIKKVMADAFAIGKKTREQAMKDPIVTDREVKPASIIKSFKRNFFDGQDEVTDVKGIIRSRSGVEDQAITQLNKAHEDLADMWNNKPENKQLAFILSMERPDLIKTEPQQVQKLAELYRERFDKGFEMIKEVFPEINYIEDYFPRFWEKPEKAKNVFNGLAAKSPMEGSKTFAKKRFYQSIVDGIEAKLTPITTNPEELARMHEGEVWKLKTARDIFSDMHNLGLVKYSTAADLPPEWKSVDDPLFNKIGAYVTKNGEAKLSMGKYMMAPEVADLINDYLKPGLKGPVKDIISHYNRIKNSFQLGFSAFHYGTTTIEAIINGVTVGLQKLSTFKPKLMLEGVKDIVTAPNVISQVKKGMQVKRDYEAGNITTDVQHLMDVNARTGKQKMYALDAWYNAKKAIGQIKADSDFSKIPKAALNTVLTVPEMINKPLMEHWVPSLKVAGYIRSLESEMKVRPNMTPRELQQAKEKIWDSMDDRLGHVVYDNVFVKKAYKDLAFMAIRSAGWTGGTIRTMVKGVAELPLSGKRILKGEGATQRTADVASMFLTVGAFGGMLHYVLTGSAPQTLEDYFWPKDGTKTPDGKDRRITFPSYVKDYLSYIKEPGTTFSHKFSPFVNDFTEIISNKDFYGENIFDKEDPIFKQGIDVIKHNFETMMPFGLQSNKQTQAPNLQQRAEQFIGLAEAPKSRERTDTENDIMKAYVEQMGSRADGVSHEAMEQRIARRHIREQMFTGTPWEDVDDDLKSKANIKPDKLEEFKKEAKMDPFIRYFKGLKGEVRQDIFDGMDDEEQEKYKQYLPKEK